MAVRWKNLLQNPLHRIMMLQETFQSQPTRRNRKEKNMISGLLSPMHLIVILVIVLIVFGPGKLPELGESLGKSIKSFKKSMEEPEGKEDSKKETKQIDDGK